MKKAYDRCKEYSEETLRTLRGKLKSYSADKIIVTCGSFARREASANSYLDYFVVTTDKDSVPKSDQPVPDWLEALERTATAVVPKTAADDGAFRKVELQDEILHNIGGLEDSNEKITRRILFLLEGEWLGNEAGFRELRHEVLCRYIRDNMTDHQLALFLLNDIIRYYRTMAVDYEFKTEESNKPWAIRTSN